MTYRPSFTKVTLTNDILLIRGLSPSARNQLQVLIAVQQGRLHAEKTASLNPDSWHAEIAVDDLREWRDPPPLPPGTIALPPDPLPPAAPFDPRKPLVIYGTEVRANPFTTISWHQVKDIEHDAGAPETP